MFVCPECGQSEARAGHCTADGARLADGSTDALLGQTIGSYRIARLIGAGGMGSVYKAVQPSIGSRVAIKLLSHDPARSPSLVERFFSEARAVNVIRHEHIVNVLDLSALPDGRPYIVMEYLDGEPLASVLERRGALPLGTLARMISEVLDALGAAHAKGVVHRDLKPDNLFVSPNGHMKVLDFGIAKLRGEIGTPGDGTRTGALLGTPHYMAPEQAMARPVDARADLYAVGVILYEAATGKKPFDAPSLFELLRLHIERRPEPPRMLRPEIPPAYESVILRALEKDPALRFQSAAELAQALGEATRFVGDDAWARVHAGTVRTASMAATHEGTLPASLERAALLTPGTQVAATPPPPSPFVAQHASYSGAVMPPPPAPAKKSSTSLLVVFAAIAAVVLVGGALLVIATVIGSGVSTANVDDEPPPAPTVATPATPGVAVPSPFVVPGTIRPAGFDPKSFDVWGFFDEATRLAEKEQSDARFVRLDAQGLRPSGHVDLTQTGNTVLYRYRSPSLSVPPAGFPENKKYEGECIVYVYADQNGVRTYPAKWSCDWPFLAKPRCSPAQIWKAAERRGAPTGNLVANIGFWADDSGRGRWLLDVTDRFSQFVPDSC